MEYRIFLLAAFIGCVTSEKVKSERINLRKIVEEVNSDPESTWKADAYGQDFVDKEEFVKTRLGLRLPIDLEKLDNFKNGTENPFFTGPKQSNDVKVGGFDFLPKFYDARQQYKTCRSIGMIRDQSNCGSCWAVSAASVLSDRICIHSNGRYNILLSGQHTTSCDKSNHGCRGGYLDKVWRFYRAYGVVTGGEFESDEGCQDYEIRPCGRYPNPKKMTCADPLSLTPKCRARRCTNEWYQYPVEKYVFRVNDYYQVGDEYITFFNEFLIKLEIFTNGPVQAGFLVYRDFLTYKSGIYEHRGPWYEIFFALGGHAVKIVGWGEEKGVKYWIAVNSWSEDWGENGTFRIVRGRNNCLFESMVYAGNPAI